MTGIGDKVKGAVESVKDKVTGHKDEKAVHKGAEEHHKGQAKGGLAAAKEDVKDAAGHAKTGVGAQFDKNKAEAGEKIGKDKQQAENLAAKHEAKGVENQHKDAAGDKLGDAWQNLKGGKDHAEDAAIHKKEKNKVEAQQKTDEARAKTSDRAHDSATS